jgi:hypothetical protein
MGVQQQLFIEIKNSFIHISDQIERDVLYRPRAMSEYSGSCRVKEMQLKESTSVPISSMFADSEEAWCTGCNVCGKFLCIDAHAHDASMFADSEEEGEARTTVMMRDIPNSYSCNRLVDLFDAAGFQGTYDFLYLPIDFRTNMSLGYAFVNFVSSRDAQEFMLYFDGFSNWHFSSAKVCNVFWSDPNQGLDEHVERYRNSPVMHENVPDDFKPRLYAGSVRVAFPAPTKHIKLPRLRPAKHRR